MAYPFLALVGHPLEEEAFPYQEALVGHPPYLEALEVHPLVVEEDHLPYQEA